MYNMTTLLLDGSAHNGMFAHMHSLVDKPIDSSAANATHNTVTPAK